MRHASLSTALTRWTGAALAAALALTGLVLTPAASAVATPPASVVATPPASVVATGVPAPAGWVVDGWGGLHRFGNAPAVTGSAYWPGWDIAAGSA